MAISILSSATANTIQAGISVAKPSGTVSGDLLIFAMCGKNNPVFSPPSGFTQIGSTLTQGTQRNLLVAYKVAGGSEPSSYTPTVSAGDSSDMAVSTAAAILRISGQHSSPIDSSNTAQSTTTVPTVTINTANSMCLSIVGANDAPSLAATVPSTWTSAISIVTSENPGEEDARLQIAYLTFGSTGAIGTHNWGSSRNNLFSVVIAPQATGSSSSSAFFLMGEF